MAYPARMAYFNNGLYLPASYGTHDIVMPEGGLRTANEAIIHGINQAIVVRDIDTPSGGNITVQLAGTHSLTYSLTHLTTHSLTHLTTSE